MQERHAELLLEQAHLTRQRGLGDVQLLGGPGEVALARDCQEVLQPA